MQGWRRRSGFTLIEVLVTVVILTSGIVFVLQALDTSTVALAAARDALWAHDLTREKLAELEEQAARSDDSLPATQSGRFAGRYSDFRWGVQSGTAPDAEPLARTGGRGGTLVEVTLTVWRDGSRRRYTTYVLMRDMAGTATSGGAL